MDFVTRLPRSVKKNEAIWVIVDRLTKSAHFIPVRMTFTMDRFAQLYIEKIVSLHGVPVSIVTIQTLEDMLRTVVLDLDGNEVGERRIFGPEIIERTIGVIAKIRDRIKAAQDRQKSYADRRRKDLQFEVNDKVFLKVAPLKGVVRFGDVAYRLALPPSLRQIHNVFHISMLGKYIADPSHIINHEELDVVITLLMRRAPSYFGKEST
ncbi:hypothetical protein DH2020_041530 [Rehmannia glutinosa]|uniref:Tf2-1-like SH3-like domain-containing protein n=1 Tax=Rehmannia glutinosa TaxID=99300 RepID=A0ABR0UPX8_REHGL